MKTRFGLSAVSRNFPVMAALALCAIALTVLPGLAEPDSDGVGDLEAFLGVDSPRDDGYPMKSGAVSETARTEPKGPRNHSGPAAHEKSRGSELKPGVLQSIRESMAEESDSAYEVADYTEVMKIDGRAVAFAQWGTGSGRVGGQIEDREMLSEGFPPSFCLDRGGKILVLDSVNRRVMGADSASGGNGRPVRLETLFICPRESVCIDIDVLCDGRIAVADVAGRKILIYSAAGNVIGTIEEVDPVEIAADSEGGLWVRDASSGLVLLFGRELRLTARYPAWGAFLARGGGGAWCGDPVGDGETPAITRVGPSGRLETFAILPPAEGYYSCQARVLGLRKSGGLLVAHLQGRDTDESGERHEYFIELVSLNAGGEILARKRVQPFRARPFHMAPRLFHPWGDEGVATFFFDDSGYTISVIDLGR